MGAKFYRGADKPKKIRKRFSQTRSWFRTLKWVACKYNSPNLTVYSRSCPSNYGCWTSLQGFLGPLDRSDPTPRPQEIWT